MSAFRKALEAQGLPLATPAQLREDAEEARHRYEALLATPGLPQLLSRLVPAVSIEGGQEPENETNCWDRKLADRRSVPRIAADCAEALRRLAPRLLASDSGAEPSDKQRLLTSFSERYDVLFEQHEGLRRKCRELQERQPDHDRLADEVSAWQAAYSTATARVEDLSLQNADLRGGTTSLLKGEHKAYLGLDIKERTQQLQSSTLDPEERSRWRDLVAQREAELLAAGAALRQLQEVMEDGAGDDSARCARLEAELRELRRAAAQAEANQSVDAQTLQEAREVATGAAGRQAELLERCRAAEAELRENGAALEALLSEKGRHLDEREHLVDRRLVTSTLSQCLEHLSSGRAGFAQQVLGQTLQVLGGEPEEASALRQQVRNVVERQRAAAEPLGDAFLDFLTREASDAELEAKQGAPIV